MDIDQDACLFHPEEAWSHDQQQNYTHIERYVYSGCSALTGPADESCDELHQSRTGILTAPQSLNGNVGKFNQNADEIGYFGAPVGEN